MFQTILMKTQVVIHFIFFEVILTNDQYFWILPKAKHNFKQLAKKYFNLFLEKQVLPEKTSLTK